MWGLIEKMDHFSGGYSVYMLFFDELESVEAVVRESKMGHRNRSTDRHHLIVNWVPHYISACHVQELPLVSKDEL